GSIPGGDKAPIRLLQACYEKSRNLARVRIRQAPALKNTHNTHTIRLPSPACFMPSTLSRLDRRCLDISGWKKKLARRDVRWVRWGSWRTALFAAGNAVGED